jgi:hypothetical protein
MKMMILMVLLAAFAVGCSQDRRTDMGYRTGSSGSSTPGTSTGTGTGANPVASGAGSNPSTGGTGPR